MRRRMRPRSRAERRCHPRFAWRCMRAITCGLCVVIMEAAARRRIEPRTNDISVIPLSEYRVASAQAALLAADDRIDPLAVSARPLFDGAGHAPEHDRSLACRLRACPRLGFRLGLGLEVAIRVALIASEQLPRHRPLFLWRCDRCLRRRRRRRVDGRRSRRHPPLAVRLADRAITALAVSDGRCRLRVAVPCRALSPA